jgi:hypothetical protein
MSNTILGLVSLTFRFSVRFLILKIYVVNRDIYKVRTETQIGNFSHNQYTYQSVELRLRTHYVNYLSLF